VSVMTTRLASSPVAHAGGKQCEHLTGTQTCYPASTSSGGLRPKPHLEGRKDFRTMSGVLMLGWSFRRSRLIARFRSVAITWGPPVVRSTCQWRRFSILQCPRSQPAIWLAWAWASVAASEVTA
jgi:hypothetical protein